MSRRTSAFVLALVAASGCRGSTGIIDSIRSAVSFGSTRETREPAGQAEGGAPTPAVSDPVGVIEARFDVTTSGAATYQVPIKVPPGTLKVEPRLTLSYDSLSDEGIAGVGMHLGGLSSIERCAPTIANDGDPGSITYTAEDRFCLDGVRLMMVEGKSYGADGAVYHTEGESWVRVVSHGSCASSTQLPGDPVGFHNLSGPCSFTVTLKDGRTAEYSSAAPPLCSTLAGRENGVRLSWPVTRITDLHNNYMTIAYEQAGANECTPSQIDYTGNDKTGVAPQRRVTFDYAPRADVIVRYKGGVKHSLGQKLMAIKTWVLGPEFPGGQLVRRYELGYELGNDTARNRLVQLKECAADGSCLPPTKLKWQNGAWMDNGDFYFDRDETELPNLALAGGTEQMLSGDFNGDGKPDFLQLAYVYSDMTPQNPPPYDHSVVDAYLYLSKPGLDSPLFTRTTWQKELKTIYGLQVADFNGDGVSDLLRTQDGKGWELFLGGNGLPKDPDFSGDQHSGGWLGDYDGDGRTDVLVRSGKGWSVYLFNGVGFVRSVALSGSFPDISTNFDESLWWDEWADNVKYYQGDYNGDGRLDFLAVAETRAICPDGDKQGQRVNTWRMFISTPHGFVEKGRGTLPHWSLRYKTGDFNGDGMTDLLVTADQAVVGGQQGYVMLQSTGVGFVSNYQVTDNVDICWGKPTPLVVPWGYTANTVDLNDEIFVANLNDDGLDDIVSTCRKDMNPNCGYETKLFRSMGDQFVFASQLLFDSGYDRALMVADFFGNGRSVLYHYGSSSLSTEAHFQGFYTQKKPDLMVGITDGINAQIDVAYLPMTSPDIYTKGKNPAYPSRALMASRYLVRSVIRHDGHENNYPFSYTYEDARTDLNGRGMLGFRRVTIENPDNTSLTNEYYTEYPFAGMLRQQERRSFGNVVGRTSFAYEDKWNALYPGVHNVVLENETSSDFFVKNGVDDVHNAGKWYQYDAFGNVTLVIDDGDVTDPLTRVQTKTDYSNDASMWRLGYPTDVVVYTNDPDKPLSKRHVDYDKERNVRFEGQWDDVNAKYLGNTQTYYGNGNPKTIEDPVGGITELEYDDYGFIKSSKNPLKQVTTKAIDPRFGLERQHKDANGNLSNISFDGFGRTVQVTGPDPNGVDTVIMTQKLTSVGFGWVSQSFSKRSWNGAEWDWNEEFHDALGRKYRTRRRGLGSTAIVSDIQYQSLTLAHANSQPYFEGETPKWVTYGYDAKKRPSGIQLSPLQNSQIEYFDAEREVRKTEPNNSVTRLFMNSRQKVERKVDARLGETRFLYDGLGRLTQIVDPDKAQTTTTFDSLGHKRSVETTVSGLTSFDYDAFGRLVSETDAKQQTIKRVPDALDRTTSKEYSDGRKIVYEYDDPLMANAIGQLSHVTIWRDGAIESRYDFGYDRYGRQATIQLTIDGKSYAWSKEYDPQGRQIGETYPDGSLLRAGFDAAGNPAALELHDVLDAPGAWKSYAAWDGYNSQGRAGRLSFGNGLVSCYSYDDQRGLLHTTHTSRFSGLFSGCQERPVAGETRLVDLTYGWTPVNNIESITDELDASRSQTFKYNQTGELDTATGLWGQDLYQYSLGGNVIQKNWQPAKYEQNRLKVSPDGTELSYDLNGNVILKTHNGVTQTLDWDGDNQLRSVTSKDGESQFTYDFLGHRLKKIDPDGTISYFISADYEVVVTPGKEAIHTKYLRGPAGPIAQITRSAGQLASLMPSSRHQMLASLYSDRTIAGTMAGGWERANAWLSRPERADDLRQLVTASLAAACLMLVAHAARRRERARFFRVVRRLAPVVAFAFAYSYGFGDAQALMLPGPNGAGVPAAGTHYFHGNHIGSSVLVTDGAGQVSTHLEYDPWGMVLSQSSGTDLSRPKFAAMEKDSTGLYYANARYYDASLGRFLSADTQLGGDPLKSVSLNRYAYAANNPVTFVDPSGHDFGILAVFLIFAVVAGFLIAGTDGKIITDPAHAFDNWSWSRAIMGAWVSLMVGIASLGIGQLFSSVVVMGVKVGTALNQALTSALVSITSEYIDGERDGSRLAAYFGIGFLTGFATGMAGLYIKKTDMYFRSLIKSFDSMVTSELKQAVDPNHPMSFSFWAFTITVKKDGSVSFAGTNVMYLMQTGANLLGHVYSPGDYANKWDWETMSIEAAKPEWGAYAWLSGIVPSDPTALVSPPSLFDPVGRLMKGIVSYAIYIKTEGQPWKMGDIDLIDLAASGASEGIKSGLNSDDPLQPKPDAVTF